MDDPLYILAEKGMLKDNQKLDIQTLAWIKKESSPSINDIKKIKEKFSPLKIDIFKKYLPEEKWFLRKKSLTGIHGLGHIYRVMMYSYLICEILNVEDFRIPLISAAIHDVRRKSDKGDLYHGIRAADWCGNQIMKKYDISEEDLFKIKRSIRVHNHPDNEISSEDMNDETTLILKHADALDRFRLPKIKWWPKKEYVKLKLDPKIFNLTNYIVWKTEELILSRKYSPKEAIIYVGLETNILTK